MERALGWIVMLLEKSHIPFQITGGLAAHLYGARRPVNDIDIDIPNFAFDVILPEVRDHIIFGPDRYRDSTWDIYLMTVDYHGQETDLTGIENGLIFNKESGEWERHLVNLTDVTMVEAFGMVLPVQNARDLIHYKRKIGYDEAKHLRDVREICRRQHQSIMLSSNPWRDEG